MATCRNQTYIEYHWPWGSRRTPSTIQTGQSQLTELSLPAAEQAKIAWAAVYHGYETEDHFMF